MNRNNAVIVDGKALPLLETAYNKCIKEVTPEVFSKANNYPIERLKDLKYMTVELPVVRLGDKYYAIDYYDPKQVGEVSDGYHTFNELYEHRIQLFIVAARCYKAWVGIMHQLGEHPVWRSKLHSDGTSYDGWFVMGIRSEPGKQITYHLPIERWEETNFATTLEQAPEFDGHNSADVLKRLKELL